MNKVLNYLGIARRAGLLIAGTDPVIESLKNKAKLVFVAIDASDATIDKIEKKCFFYKIKLIKKYTTLEIGNAIGLENPKLIAITDAKIAKQIISLEELNNKKEV